MGAKRRATYKVYPNRKQASVMETMRLAHQSLYNGALEHRIGTYRRTGKSVSFSEQCRELTQLRAQDPEYGGLNAQSLQVTLKRVDLAFQHFFRRVREGATKVGFPRFKSRYRYKGWGYKTHGDGWKIRPGKDGRHGKLWVTGVGWLRLRGCPRTIGTPKTLDLVWKQGSWIASVVYDCAPQRACGRRAIGIDWGCETLATVVGNDGAVETVANPRLWRKSAEDIKACHKKLSSHKRGTRPWRRARARLAHKVSKLARRRADMQHQLTARLVSEAAVVAVEKLNVAGMTASGGAYRRGLNREILDTSPGRLHQLLKYKAEEAGAWWIEAPTRKVKPSQTCHQCGHRRKKKLSERRHECTCGAACSRDENAARVILSWALAQLEGREPSPGDGEEIPHFLETPSAAALAAQGE